jgi:hypothetical protein
MVMDDNHQVRVFSMVVDGYWIVAYGYDPDG